MTTRLLLQMCPDISPTAYFGADLAEIDDGDTVAVWGCGPVGQFAIASAKLLGAGRVFAIDRVESRLEMAREQGAEAINFEEADPTEAVKRLTGGIGVDRAIDAVGVDSETAESGPAAKEAKKQRKEFEEEVEKIAPEQNPDGELWQPGQAPSQALAWAVKSLCKAGTLSVIGVYSPESKTFPIGEAMNKNLTVRMGNCNHRRYVPMLIDLVRSGAVDPEKVLTQREPVTNVLDAYKAFDQRQPGWVKVELLPGAKAAKAKGAKASASRTKG